MKFINKGGPIKIRIGKSNQCYWQTIKRNEVVDLIESLGKGLGFEELKTTEGQIGNLVVQTKQIEITSKIGGPNGK